MTSPRFRAALRAVLHHIKEGLIWSGALWGGVPPGTVTMYRDEPLTQAERAEWAALERRLW
jgi:hypothetical protein